MKNFKNYLCEKSLNKAETDKISTKYNTKIICLKYLHK